MKRADEGPRRVSCMNPQGTLPNTTQTFRLTATQIKTLRRALEQGGL
jgi:hypothetical protein